MAPSPRTVAGSFYPASPEVLRRELMKLLDLDSPKEPVRAAIVPHAGYMYSGSVAGAVFSRMVMPEVVLVMGPDHWGWGDGASIMVEGTWETPLGRIAIETDLAQNILARSRTLRATSQGQTGEHSIEVQLPFLQALEQPFRLVPIYFHAQTYTVCQDVGQAVAEAIRESSQTVVVVASTDFTHCGRVYRQLPPPGLTAHAFAREQDRKAIEAILTLNPRNLYDTVKREQISMCGVGPATAALVVANYMDAREATLLAYKTSAEVTQDEDTAVGYAGIVIR
ncbi:MAG: AmmeMemoRadiSam system protein B [Nitrospirae bacterium]|nr:MAG: AmmeMemoRadiSam system protein B [Nitrospirota bacterium]